MSDMLPIPAGSLLTISTGAYSDYFVHGVFAALKDIDPDALRDEWMAGVRSEGVYSFDHMGCRSRIS